MRLTSLVSRKASFGRLRANAPPACPELRRRASGPAGIAVFVLAAALAASGCAGDQAALRLSAEADAGRKQAELVAQRARAEAASLRADVASARIAAAKLGAETKALHRRVEELTQAEDQRQQMVEALRVERDRLAQEVAQLHSQIAEAPPVRSSAAEGTAAPGRMKELESAVAALTRELSQMKRTMARGQAPAKSKGELLPSGATPRPSIQPAVMEVEPAPPPMAETAIVTVQRGETLWGIARRHRVSVAALKQANGLTRDVAEVGRKLIIPMTP